MTVRELLERVDSAELAEWIAYDRIEPFGDERADLRAGTIASTIANHSFSPPKRAARPIDYMPFATKPEETGVLLNDRDAQSKLIAGSIFKGVQIQQPMKAKKGR